MTSPTNTVLPRTVTTSPDPGIEFVIPRDPTGGLIPTYVGTRQAKIRNPKSKIRNLLWCFPLLLAGLCFWKGLPSVQHTAQTAATASIKAPAVKTLAPAEQSAHTTKRTLVTRPIQDIRPGHRVIAKNPELAGQDAPQIEIDPEATRLVSLHLSKPDGHEVEIDTLMSLDELQAVAVDNLDSENTLASPVGALPLPLVGSDEEVSLNELLIGHVVEMNLPELGAEGPATITLVRPCPSIEPDDGTGRRLVTSVFRHSATNVVDLETSGSTETIGVTANHPFWSEDRQEFVPAGNLCPGENLRRAEHTLVQVTRITPRRGPPVPVFNFEVDGQHVYSVGAGGLLAHNACNTIVIGEGMAAVKEVARKYGAKWYQAWGKNFQPQNFDLAKSLARQERWIRSKIAQGYKILDIGRDGRRVPSPFYGKEREIIDLLKYPTTSIPRP